MELSDVLESPQQLLTEVESLYLHGRYLDAYARAAEMGPLALWRGLKPRILAGKLARMLGDGRLANVLHYLAWREHRDSSRALSYYLRNYFSRNGLLKTLRFIDRYEALFAADSVTADLLAFQAFLYAYHRDFTRADTLMAQALARGSDNPWTHVEHAYLLELEDDYDAALEAVERALELVPYYRAAIQQKVHLLQLCGRDAESLDCLRQAATHLQSEGVESQLLTYHQEHEQQEKIQATLERIESLVPLKSKRFDQWLAGNLCNLYYLQGDHLAAAEQAELSDNHYYRQIAAALRKHQGAGRRKRLRVEFIRQRHMTCGPATLSALCGYFGRPVEQQAIIDSIWYAGTRDYDERKWASENGWHVAEFSLDWQSARDIIDAGIPCAIATQEADSAHLQALTGYDEQMEVLFIRDPYHQFEQEFLQQPFFEKYGPFGPRALVIVPEERRAELEQISLPERDSWDTLFAIRDALQQYQREEAQQLFSRQFGAAPDSDLATQARREMGWYDNNMEEVAAVDAVMFARYPDNHRIKLNQLYSLNRLSHRDSYLQLLEQEGEKPDAHLSLLTLYAEALYEDGRQQQRAEALLQDVLKLAPRLASAYQAYAYLCWSQRRYVESEQLYRIAASLDEAEEGYALDYFRLSRLNRHSDEVLAWLQQRFERNAEKSPYPAMTLYRAHELQNHEHLGLEILQQAVDRRPDDGELLLYYADALIDNGELEAADTALQQARDRASSGRWLLVAARHAARRQEYQQALDLFNELVASEPLNYRAHNEIVRLLRDLHGEEHAIEHMAQLCQRFPSNMRLHEEYIELLQHEQPQLAQRELATLIARQPNYGYAHRLLADLLIQDDRYEEAWQSLQRAAEIDAKQPGLYNLYGDYHARRGEHQEAMEHYRKVIALNADNEYAINALMRLCHSSAEKREQLAYLLQQLMAQTTHGDGLLSYQYEAHNILPQEELLATLREAWQLRPDLWQTWSTLIIELRDGGELEQALELARQSAERFPLLPRTHLDLAHVYKRLNDSEAQREALQQALRISPRWESALMELADNYERSGEYDQELEMLTAAVAANPNSSRMHGYFADALWRHGEQEQAISAIRRALELAPGYDWAWNQLREWTEHLAEEWLVEQTARAVVKRKPGLPQAWYYLAQAVVPLDEKLQALDRAIACNPNYLPAYEEKTELLVNHNRFSEARQVIDSYDRGHGIPVSLRSYLPWMEYRLGELDKAITSLKAMLEDEPAYYGGWNMLASWCAANERPGDFLLACKRLVALQPDSSDAHMRLADALQENNQTDEAKAALQAALRIMPQHEGAAIRLFDLQLEGGELEAARETLQLLRLHISPENEGYLLTREIQLETRCGDRGETFAIYHRLARTRRENPWFFTTSWEAINEAGWTEELDQANDELVQDLTDINPAFASLWAEQQHEGKSEEWKLSERSVARLLEMGRAGHRVVEDYLTYLHRIGSIMRLNRLIKRHREELMQNQESLLNVAFIFASQGRYADNIQWMANWREMQNPPAWALNNYAISLREKQYWERHYEVLQRIMPIVSDELASAVRTWLALESWLHGDLQTMQDLYPLIEAEELSNDNFYAFILLHAVVEFESSHDLSADERLSRIIAILREGHRDYHTLHENRMLWHIQTRVVKQLAQHLEDGRSQLYYRWRMISWLKFII